MGSTGCHSPLSATEIADTIIDSFTWPYDERITISATELADALVTAILTDRMQD